MSPICIITDMPTMPWDLCCASDILWYNSLLNPYNWICTFGKDKKDVHHRHIQDGSGSRIYSLRPESYSRGCNALSLAYSPCRNVCRSLRIDSDRLAGHPRYSHAVWCLCPRETQAIGPYSVEHPKPANPIAKKNVPINFGFCVWIKDDLGEFVCE